MIHQHINHQIDLLSKLIRKDQLNQQLAWTGMNQQFLNFVDDFKNDDVFAYFSSSQVTNYESDMADYFVCFQMTIKVNDQVTLILFSEGDKDDPEEEVKVNKLCWPGDDPQEIYQELKTDIDQKIMISFLEKLFDNLYSFW